jgi:hypothetical protein
MTDVRESAPKRGPSRYAAGREIVRCAPASGGVTPFGTALSNCPMCNLCAWEKLLPMCLNIQESGFQPPG